MNKIVKNAFILTAITVIAGLLLGVVYGVTKEPIANAKAKAKQEAFQSVLSDADSFETVDNLDTDAASELLKSNGYSSDAIEEVALGKDKSGETIGYVINVVSHEGYGGDIEISVGIQADGTVKGIEMLSISETAGLGMKSTEPAFKDQFKDKKVETFSYTKTGEEGDDKIDAISGATITTNAVTTSAINGIGMGLSTTAVLIMSNMMISMLRKIIPDSVRMPAFIVIVASFVTIVDFLMEGFVPSLYDSLGLYIPLIVVNCIILGRAESYASKNPVIPSIFDGIGMGLGFTVGLTSIGIVRELIGSGKIFNMQILPDSYEPFTIFILAPGAFFVLACLVALQNKVKNNLARKGKKVPEAAGCGASCASCGNAAACGGHAIATATETVAGKDE